MTLDPAGADAAQDAARHLDGDARTVVTLRRPPARLDVAGDAAGAMTAYHSADTFAQRLHWRHLATPAAPDEELVVRIARTDGYLQRRQTTTLDAALRAVDVFVADGVADPALPWSDDDPHGTRVHPACRRPTSADDVTVGGIVDDRLAIAVARARGFAPTGAPDTRAKR